MGRQGALPRVKRAYTTGARRVASEAMSRVGRTRLSPDVLTGAGVGLSVLGAVAVYLAHEGWGWLWIGAALFVVGSVLDILDGALARSRGTGSAFGAFIDSTVDRVGEGAMLAALGLVLMRERLEWGVALAFTAVMGSFLVSYTRAREESLGL